VFRGVAILSMIQGHTFTVLLKPSEYGEAWLPWYTLLHGLTAPMFLLGGGLAYGFVTLRGAPDKVQNGSRGRIVKRALILVVLGYLLQLPKAPLSELWSRPDLLACAARVGPLQLVGACLLIAEGLRAMARSGRAFLTLLSAFCLMVAGAAPFVWQVRASSRVWVPVGTWFDGYAGSLFPFFPWAAFFFMGLLASLVPRRARRHSPSSERRTALSVVLGGAALAALAYGMFLHGFVLRSLYGAYELWHTSPLYVLFRASLCFALLGLLWLSEPGLQWFWRRHPSVDRVFGVLSRQSLVAYVTHLLVLYGTPITVGLIRLGAGLNLVEAALMFLFVLCLTTAISVLWDHFVTSGLLRGRLERLASGMFVAAVRRVDRLGPS